MFGETSENVMFRLNLWRFEVETAFEEGLSSSLSLAKFSSVSSLRNLGLIRGIFWFVVATSVLAMILTLLCIPYYNGASATAFKPWGMLVFSCELLGG